MQVHSRVSHSFDSLACGFEMQSVPSRPSMLGEIEMTPSRQALLTSISSNDIITTNQGSRSLRRYGLQTGVVP